jgi:pyruvate carboxylase
MFSRWKQPPPPKPIYKNPAAVSIIVTLVIFFVFGPIGVIYNGMSEELKKKADNNTVILLLKQIKENDDRQWQEIERNRESRQRLQEVPKKVEVITKKLTPAEFEAYMNMTPEQKEKYRKYRRDITEWPE